MTTKLTLPPPRAKRGERIIVAFTEDEKQRLRVFAKKRGEKPATVARVLILSAIEAVDG